MGNISKYAAINTKVKAMERQLLRDHDYEKIIGMPDVASVVEYLKSETYYKSWIDADVSDDIGTMEGLLKKHLFVQSEKLFHYVNGNDKKFFKILFMRYEIENLKVFIRMVARKESLQRISDHIIVSESYGTIDYTRLNDARTLEDIVAGLEGTEFQKIVQLFKDEEEDKLMFYMEMNLDRLYFKNLYNYSKRLDGQSNKAITDVISRNIDMLNIQWIYRGRRFYKISQEELVNYSLLGGKHFKYEQLKEMCYKDKLSDIETMIRESAYGFIFEDVPNFEIFMERSMERYIYRYFNRLSLNNPMTLVEPMVYMHQLEYEIRDLITILEMKRYHLSSEEGKRFLVRHLE